MKSGMQLPELAKELARQQDLKRDFLAPTTQLEATHNDNEDGYQLRINGKGKFGIGRTAHQQLAQRLSIPQTYYDRMKTEAPELLTKNINYWLHADKENKMVRTLDGTARAFLSSKYRPLDNYDLSEVVLPEIMKPGFSIESATLTETRLYIKVVTAKLTAEVKKGDVVQAGIVISNSEIGLGSVKVEPMVYRLVCTNGLISDDHSLRKYHVGRGHGEGDMAEEFFRDSTRRADDKAFWMKVKDTVHGAFRKDVFENMVSKLQDSTTKAITGDPVKVVEVVQKKYRLNDKERSGILTQLIKGGDLTQYGLVNAITRHSQDVEDYDRATELERMGGQVLELPRHEWMEVSEN